MRAGGLKHRIDIQSPVNGVDAHGGNTRTWTDFQKDYPAKRRNLSGTEKRATSAGGGEYAEARVEWELRYLPGLNETMRILHDGKVFNIRAVLDIEERHRTMIVITDTGVSLG